MAAEVMFGETCCISGVARPVTVRTEGKNLKINEIVRKDWCLSIGNIVDIVNTTNETVRIKTAELLKGMLSDKLQ